MPIIMLVVWLALIGLAVYLVITYIPMPQAIKTLIVIVVVVLIVIWLIQITGLIGVGPSVPRLR